MLVAHLFGKLLLKVVIHVNCHGMHRRGHLGTSHVPRAADHWVVDRYRLGHRLGHGLGHRLGHGLLDGHHGGRALVIGNNVGPEEVLSRREDRSLRSFHLFGDLAVKVAAQTAQLVLEHVGHLQTADT